MLIRSNRKGIVISLIVIGIFTGILVSPSIIRSVKMNKYQGFTEARVINIAERKTDVSSYAGSGTKLIGYRITYSYLVNGESYTSTESIKPGAEANKLFEYFSSGQNCTVGIRYLSDTPEESLISNLILEAP